MIPPIIMVYCTQQAAQNKI